MPPKLDPYATPLHRRIDAALLILSVATIGVFLAMSTHSNADALVNRPSVHAKGVTP
jgi:hypothetical protein